MALLAISVIDAKTMMIPDLLILVIVVISIFWMGYLGFSVKSLVASGLGVLTGGLFLWMIDRITLIIAEKDGFGYGDMKLMAACGIFLGWQLVLVAFFIAFVTGAVFAIFLVLTKKIKQNAYMPFGPFLCLGAVFAWFFGDLLIRSFF